MVLWVCSCRLGLNRTSRPCTWSRLFYRSNSYVVLLHRYDAVFHPDFGSQNLLNSFGYLLRRFWSKPEQHLALDFSLLFEYELTKVLVESNDNATFRISQSKTSASLSPDANLVTETVSTPCFFSKSTASLGMFSSAINRVKAVGKPSLLSKFQWHTSERRLRPLF